MKAAKLKASPSVTPMASGPVYTMGRRNPVSYTHLDVYKRQVLSSFPSRSTYGISRPVASTMVAAYQVLWLFPVL